MTPFRPTMNFLPLSAFAIAAAYTKRSHYIAKKATARPMQVVTTQIPGVLIIEPKRFGDARGFFSETFRSDRYADAGLVHSFVQDNWSRSRRGVLRGLHLQNPNAQGKLVMVVQGAVLDVAVDVRVGSPSFGQ